MWTNRFVDTTYSLVHKFFGRKINKSLEGELTKLVFSMYNVIVCLSDLESIFSFRRWIE